jgi:hypothetical protein
VLLDREQRNAEHDKAELRHHDGLIFEVELKGHGKRAFFEFLYCPVCGKKVTA